MRFSRRQFACGLAGAFGLAGVTALATATTPDPAGIWERRVYAHGSALPTAEALRRSGVCPVSLECTNEGTVYVIPFVTLEARAQAWDRFNADQEWHAIRDLRNVALREIRVYPAGKIFEISL